MMIKETLFIPLESGLKMDFVLIKPGSFMMGSNMCNPDEKPVHRVAITKPFYIGVYVVTQAQWKAITGDNPAGEDYRGDDFPVVHVSWTDCQRFMTNLTEKADEGVICRLPTEAEWEYACRADSKTEYSFGDDPASLGEYVWFGRGGTMHPVGQKKPNAWGLYDMHGTYTSTAPIGMTLGIMRRARWRTRRGRRNRLMSNIASSVAVAGRTMMGPICDLPIAAGPICWVAALTLAVGL